MATRIQKDLAELSSVLQDGKKLKEAATRICQKHRGIAVALKETKVTAFNIYVFHDSRCNFTKALLCECIFTILRFLPSRNLI
jgi:hypothetical protein